MGNKIQKIYVGTNLVRPIQTFYYNFVGKTIAQANSDLGTTFSSSYGIDSNGLYSSSGNNVFFNSNLDLTNANKITYYITGRLGNGSTEDLITILASDTSSTGKTGLYQSKGSYNQIFLGGSTTNYTNTISNYEFEVYCIVDLVNKTAKIQYTKGSSFTNTYTLTDSQVTTIRGGLSLIRITMAGTNPRLKILKITVQ